MDRRRRRDNSTSGIDLAIAILVACGVFLTIIACVGVHEMTGGAS